MNIYSGCRCNFSNIQVAAMSDNQMLAYENVHALSLVQALLGGITQNLRAVALQCNEAQKHVHLIFVMYRESDECHEEIEEIVLEFLALQQTWIEISKDVIIIDNTRSIVELEIEGRFVFLRKESFDDPNLDSDDGDEV